MYFNSIQTLRGFFALMIFFHHYHFRQNGGCMFNAGGDCGVAFFFILSGFILMQGSMDMQNRTCKIVSKTREYVSFIIKRLSKIYPLHLLCLLVVIFLEKTITIQDISNLFLLQSWIPYYKWYSSGNPVGWCLSDFLFFYAIFPFLHSFYIRNRRRFEIIFLGMFYKLTC